MKLAKLDFVQYNIHEAKSSLSRLVQLAEQGEEVLLARAGRPVAKIVRLPAQQKRVLGAAAGQIRMKPGWDAPLTDSELSEFLGR